MQDRGPLCQAVLEAFAKDASVEVNLDSPSHELSVGKLETFMFRMGKAEAQTCAHLSHSKFSGF